MPGLKSNWFIPSLALFICIPAKHTFGRPCRMFVGCDASAILRVYRILQFAMSSPSGCRERRSSFMFWRHWLDKWDFARRSSTVFTLAASELWFSEERSVSPAPFLWQAPPPVLHPCLCDKHIYLSQQYAAFLPLVSLLLAARFLDLLRFKWGNLFSGSLTLFSRTKMPLNER